MFDDCKVKPLSIHVLVQNRVWCLNLTTEEISEPEPRDKGMPKGVFMMGRPGPGGPPQESPTPGEGDWTMAEEELASDSRSERVVAAKAPDKVRHERRG